MFLSSQGLGHAPYDTWDNFSSCEQSLVELLAAVPLTGGPVVDLLQDVVREVHVRDPLLGDAGQLGLLEIKYFVQRVL